ncbi:hypothetical protein ACLB1O_08380 [Escherichia coli]
MFASTRWFVKEEVTGVQAGDDILESEFVVILADGVNSMLGRSLEMVPASRSASLRCWC